MTACPKCGRPLPEGAKYCPVCGTSVSVPASSSRARLSYEPDMLGAISGGMILIILAATYLVHPIDIVDVTNYFRTMGELGRFIKPPLILLNAAIFFFNVMAIWSIILAAMRVILQNSIRRSLSDLAGALFSFFTAYLITNYRDNVLTERAALAFFIIGLGGIVVLNAIVNSTMRRNRPLL